jgi:hypothetical protein
MSNNKRPLHSICAVPTEMSDKSHHTIPNKNTFESFIYYVQKLNKYILSITLTKQYLIHYPLSSWGGRTRWPWHRDHLWFIVSLIWFPVIPDLSTRAVWQLPAETSCSDAGKLVEEMSGPICLRSISFRWEDGIRMDVREIGLGGVDWIRLSQDRDR